MSDHQDRTDELSRLQNQEAPDLTEMGLQYRAIPLAQAFSGRLPTASELRHITEELGAELATAVFYRCVLNAKSHGGFLRKTQQFNLSTWAEKKPQASSFEVTIVASQLPFSGRKWGDHVEEWRRWARDLGCTTEVIETDPQLSVANNARLIRDHLMKQSHTRRIVVTYGQGASEFRYFLHKSAEVERDADLTESLKQQARQATSGVLAWISVGGSFSGAGSSGWRRKNAWRRITSALAMKWAGRHPVVLGETSPEFFLWRQPVRLPRQMLTVSLVGLPMRSQLPAGLNLTYHELAKVGPNDGLVTAIEASVPHGFIVPVLGMSHRAEGRVLMPVFKRVLALTLTALLERRESAHLSDDERPSSENVSIKTK